MPGPYALCGGMSYNFEGNLKKVAVASTSLVPVAVVSQPSVVACLRRSSVVRP